MVLHKVGSVVQLNQGDTKANWIVVDVASAQKGQLVLLAHEDELDKVGGWMPADCLHASDINHKDRALLLSAFAATKRGKELVKGLMQA